MDSRKQGGRGAEALGSKKPIRSHRELEVYQLAIEASMKIFELSKNFPAED